METSSRDQVTTSSQKQDESSCMDEASREVVRRACVAAWAAAPLDVRPASSTMGYQFASTLVQAMVTIDIPMVVKTKPPEEFRRAVMMSDQQFHNELLVYNKLLPLIGAEHMAPKLYSGKSDGSLDDFIALERLEGFEPCRQRPFLDLAHLEAALRKLAVFHGLSYNAKACGGLAQAASRLSSTGFSVRDPAEWSVWMKASFMRAIEPNRGVSPEVEEMIQAVEEMPALVAYLESGSEPLSVLCHGDYCANNMMFRYSPDGTLQDVKLIDFQTSRYSSPIIDLSFFLYLNSSAETRSVHWDRLIELYLSVLEETLEDPASYPGREAFLEELARKATYGLLHCSFFLPVMIMGVPPMEELEIMNPNDPETIKKMTSIAGDEGTRAVAAVFRHLLDKGYIRALLDNYKR